MKTPKQIKQDKAIKEWLKKKNTRQTKPEQDAEALRRLKAGQNAENTPNTKKYSELTQEEKTRLTTNCDPIPNTPDAEKVQGIINTSLEQSGTLDEVRKDCLTARHLPSGELIQQKHNIGQGEKSVDRTQTLKAEIEIELQKSKTAVHKGKQWYVKILRAELKGISEGRAEMLKEFEEGKCGYGLGIEVGIMRGKNIMLKEVLDKIDKLEDIGNKGEKIISAYDLKQKLQEIKND